MRDAAGARQAGHKVKGFDGPDGANEVAVAFDPLFYRCGMSLADAADSEMRHEGRELEGHAGREEQIVDLLAQAMKKGMAVADARPDDAGLAAWRETARAFHAEREWRHIHAGQRLDDESLLFVRDLADETQREVELLRRRPARPREIPGQLRQRRASGIAREKGNEETVAGLGWHGPHDMHTLRGV